MFDRGNTLSWFQSTEIRIEAFVAVLCAYLFIVQICTRERPFIEPSIFRDRNFTMATLLGFVLGFNMMASMALLPPFMQTLLNYPVLDTGMLLAPRGVGMMISMTLVGRLVERVDARHVITLGLLVSAYSVWEMTLFDINVQESQLMYTGFVQGIGMGCTFVPLSTIAFSTIDPRKRADAVGFYSLGRNVGSSIGVSILMGALAVFVRQNRSWLTNEINPYNHVLGGGVLPAQMDLSNKAGLEMFNFIVQREAMMLGYLNDFRLMLVFSLIAIPLVYVMRDGRPRSGR
jgi:DHA2 family multidrug resistance protein